MPGSDHDGRVPLNSIKRVNRLDNETRLTVVFPKNPVARESVTRYIAALKSVYARVADGRGAVARCAASLEFDRRLD